MSTRREFIKNVAGVAGIVFTSCSLLDAAHAQSQPAAKRRQVVINGRRVKTIDTHTHCLFQQAIDLMGEDAKGVVTAVKGAQGNFIVVEERLRAMDELGIDMQVLSINPFWYGKERDVASAIVKLQNEKLAELCASRPDRFAAFASLAMQYPDLAVEQLETAVKKQGLDRK